MREVRQRLGRSGARAGALRLAQAPEKIWQADYEQDPLAHVPSPHRQFAVVSQGQAFCVLCQKVCDDKHVISKQHKTRLSDPRSYLYAEDLHLLSPALAAAASQVPPPPPGPPPPGPPPPGPPPPKPQAVPTPSFAAAEKTEKTAARTELVLELELVSTPTTPGFAAAAAAASESRLEDGAVHVFESIEEAARATSIRKNLCSRQWQ